MTARNALLALAVSAAAAAGAAPAPAVKGTVSTANGAQSGMVTWSAASRKYTIQIPMGTGFTSTEVAERDVTDVTIEKPKDYDSIVRNKNKKKLEEIIKTYSHLKWDVSAAAVLADIKLAEGDRPGALKTCEETVGVNPEAAWKGELAPAYWRALLVNGKSATLEKHVKKAIASGDRFSSGSALIMRGDMIMQGGKTQENAKEALVKGYLRTALLYTEDGVREKLAPEAFAKAAECLEILGYSAKAQEFKSRAAKP